MFPRSFNGHLLTTDCRCAIGKFYLKCMHHLWVMFILLLLPPMACDLWWIKVGTGAWCWEIVNLRNMFFFLECDDLILDIITTHTFQSLLFMPCKWLLTNGIWSYNPMQAWVPKTFSNRVTGTGKRKTTLVFLWAEHNALWFFYTWSFFHVCTCYIDGASDSPNCKHATQLT